MPDASPSDLVREYLDAVVNQRRVEVVDRLVAPDYTGGGHGWPATRADLQAFYEWQAAARPDWRIDVQETVEVGDCVVVRAHAGGTVEDGEVRRLEWLAAYWLEGGRITRIEVLALQPRR